MPVGGREEAEAGEHEGDPGHGVELGPGAQEHGEQHPLSRRPENVAVYQLPAELLLSVLAAVNLMKKCLKFITSSQKNIQVLKKYKNCRF